MKDEYKICESCGKNRGEIRIFQMIGGKRSEIFVCKKCARTIGISEQLGNFPENPDSVLKVKRVCRNCGWTTKDFLSTALLGCPECYEEFSSELRTFSLLPDVVLGHSKIPPPVVDPKAQITALKWQIEQAVKQEEFEKAAKLRDQLRELELKLKSQGLL